MNKEEQVMNGFRELYNKLVWLNKDKMEEGLKGFKSSEVHCIEYIENNANSNVTQLAEAFYVTRGAISRMTKKLIQKGLVESYQKSENKKEIYKIHENLHKEFQERDKAVFEQVTEEEFDSIISFVEKYSRHLDAEIKKQGIHIKS
ncbi:MarR family transcriptional regulator [Bacillus cereus]|nr:MarR family transcriptional regulator [Bacillus cereus]